MKKLSTTLLAVLTGVCLLSIASSALAADEGKEKEKTIKGEAKCAKCALKEADKCQTVIQTEEKKDGKAVTYYLDDNDVTKAFHKNVCTESKKVTAKGTTKKEADGKHHFVATKIELAQ